MQGIELSRSFYESNRSRLYGAIPSGLHDYMAAGLVGEGSECFGYDDFFSRDHDFGPDFCVWVPAQIYRENRNILERAYLTLPASHRGYTRDGSGQMAVRRGIMTIEGFYQKYTGISHVPEQVAEWFRIPSGFLSAAVNGEVFEDRYGVFTEWRKRLLAFYPEDVIRKKLAAKVVTMAQAGQYNYVRCCRREHWESACLAGGEFVRAALSVVYLLNRKYMPYYKWAFRGARELEILSQAVEYLRGFVRLADLPENMVQKKNLIEVICQDTAEVLRKQGYSECREAFLERHGYSIMQGIEDEDLRRMHVLADVD